ncbi:MAG: alkaline phosphatase family protein [Candidatus Cybelea sp.]
MTCRAGALCSWAIAASIALSGCGGASNATPPLSTQPPSRHHRTASPIQHVVLIVQENRTFNNLFAGFPGATSSLTGEELVKQGSGYVEQQIDLSKTKLTDKQNIAHLYRAFLVAWQKGAMDGFSLVKYVRTGQPEGKTPYQYVDPAQIVPYRTMATQWGLADEMFQTQGSDSFTAHQDLIRGGTFINATQSLIDPPTAPYTWGCDSGPGSKTTVITTALKLETNKGPFPCSKDFPNYGSDGYKTLRDLLDAKALTWKYYTPQFEHKTPNGMWNAFDVIAPVRYGPEWTTNISSPETNVISDIQNGTLPSMSWVIPDAANSDHPGYARKDTGPSWVADIVNAIGGSQYWNSTAVIVVWDDWGGFYDPVAPPPQDNQGGPGFRVPMIVVSPYVKLGSGSKGGYVSHTVYEFGSILRFVEDTFGLGRLGTTDSTSTSMADMFDLGQSPRTFQQIPSKYSKEYFLREKPSNLPVDTE